MKRYSDFIPILMSFRAVGLRFPYESRKRRWDFLRNAMLFSVEMLFVSFAAYMLLHSLFSPQIPVSMKLTTVSSQMTLLCLRLTIFFKKRQILDVINSLENLALRAKAKMLRKKVIVACVLCFAAPSLLSLAIIVYFFQDRTLQLQAAQQYFFNRTTPEDQATLMVIISVSQTFYTLHLFIFPGLTLNLLMFLYLKYAQVFKSILSKIRTSLEDGVTTPHGAKVLSLLTTGTRNYCKIEDAISVITFLAYVLTFVNFIGLIPLLSSGYFSEFETIKNIMSLYIFGWTTFWFCVVTLCGSKTCRIGDDVRGLTRDLLHDFTCADSNQKKDLLRLLLFCECIKFDLCFTGWGMFRVDRKLILTTVGVIVTYGMLLYNN